MSKIHFIPEILPKLVTAKASVMAVPYGTVLFLTLPESVFDDMAKASLLSAAASAFTFLVIASMSLACCWRSQSGYLAVKRMEGMEI